MINTQVVGVVAFYMVAALIMVFVNKAVLISAPNLTVLFMFFQSIMTVILLHFTALFTSVVTIPTLELATARKLAWLIIVDAAGFVFNALCLRDVEAAFFQVARGLVLPLTISIVSIHSRSTPSWKVCGCALVVTIGFFIGVSPSEELPEKSVPTPLALFYGFLSSMAIACHAVLIKISLPHVDGSSTQLSYWSNLGSAIIIGITAILKGEVLEFVKMSSGGSWDWSVFAWGNLVTGFVGFLMSIAGILSVKVTSPVTHMFSSAARSVLQVALGIRIFGDILTVQRAASIFTILCGTLLYTWVKSREPPPPPPVLPPKDIEAQQLMPMEEQNKTQE
ncbi:hypothetical protein BU17DRAFT_48198 [Hysterangium stoloniferum]|nr:hypothetical protein BU17DRAFT_48198 [Hysterangium stoloniferum]